MESAESNGSSDYKSDKSKTPLTDRLCVPFLPAESIDDLIELSRSLETKLYLEREARTRITECWLSECESAAALTVYCEDLKSELESIKGRKMSDMS